jgi:DnaJ family protein C protein 13
MTSNEKRLLKRMVPYGFLAYLKMPPLSAAEELQLDEIERDSVEENISDTNWHLDEQLGVSAPSTSSQQGAAGTNSARLRSRIAIALATAKNTPQSHLPENFRIFFHVLTQDHSLPDLIWSQQTRRELRIALESEIQYVQREMEARGVDNVAWNHQQFRVKYPSLDNEVKVGNVYMRLWLNAGDGFIRSWDDPVRLFEHLFRRFLCEIDRNDKVIHKGLTYVAPSLILLTRCPSFRLPSCASDVWNVSTLFTPPGSVHSRTL